MKVAYRVLAVLAAVVVCILLSYPYLALGLGALAVLLHLLRPRKTKPGLTGGYRDQHHIARDTLAAVTTEAGLTEAQAEIVRRGLRLALAKEAEACLGEIENAEDAEIRTILRSRIDPKVYGQDLAGALVTHHTDTPYWAEWFPGLQSAPTLQSVYDSLPGLPPEKIHWMVRLFENPKSPLAFRGAIALKGHDLIHCILGRGLTDQDEAFVLGFTMGAVRNITALETGAFRLVLRSYPEPYRVLGDELRAFDLGVEAGKACTKRDLHKYPLEELLLLPLAEARAKLGIPENRLRQTYARERALIPNSPASLRLQTV